MDELVYLRNDEAVCSSLQVAEKFEKRHDNVMRSIEGLLKNEETHEMLFPYPVLCRIDGTDRRNVY